MSFSATGLTVERLGWRWQVSKKKSEFDVCDSSELALSRSCFVSSLLKEVIFVD